MLIAFSAVMPSAAQARDKWGSIFFSTSNLANGYSYRQPSREDAEDAAFETCSSGADDCEKAVSFRNACGALAVGRGNGWGASWGSEKSSAQRKAMNICRQNTSGCRIIRWQCSG